MLAKGVEDIGKRQTLLRGLDNSGELGTISNVPGGEFLQSCSTLQYRVISQGTSSQLVGRFNTRATCHEAADFPHSGNSPMAGWSV